MDSQSHYSYFVRFCRERAPLPVILVMGFALVVAVRLPKTIETQSLILAGVSAALFMLVIRLWDDLSDREVDAMVNPDRLIPSQPNSVPKLFNVSLAICFILLVLNYQNTHAGGLLLICLVSYGLFFQIKDHLPVPIQLIILNASLGVTAVYTHVLFNINVTTSAILYASFFTLGGLAHDCTHSVITPSHFDETKAHPLHYFNQRSLALCGLLLFVVASAVGVTLYLLNFANVFFVTTLGITTIIIAFLSLRLIGAPNEQNAKPFYVLGFVFFLLPGLIQFLSQRV